MTIDKDKKQIQAKNQHHHDSFYLKRASQDDRVWETNYLLVLIYPEPLQQFARE